MNEEPALSFPHHLAYALILLYQQKIQVIYIWAEFVDITIVPKLHSTS